VKGQQVAKGCHAWVPFAGLVGQAPAQPTWGKARPSRRPNLPKTSPRGSKTRGGAKPERKERSRGSCRNQQASDRHCSGLPWPNKARGAERGTKTKSKTRRAPQPQRADTQEGGNGRSCRNQQQPRPVSSESCTEGPRGSARLPGQVRYLESRGRGKRSERGE
jgi:hypothetical protein